MDKKITIMTVLPEGIAIGLKNLVSLLGAVVLYVLTIWIPYLNVGTTIAMATIPIELAKGKIINPLFIFDAKYRKYMGDYFILVGLQFIATYVAFCFFIIPGIILSISWSLSVYLLLDKKVSPLKSLDMSNKATYGYKWTIFGVQFLIGLAIGLVGGLLGLIPVVGTFLVIVVAICAMPIMLGCNTVIYKKLILEEGNNETETNTVEEL